MEIVRSLSLLTKEPSTTLNNPKEEEKIDNTQSRNNSIQLAALALHFRIQVSNFPLGLFGSFSHLPNIIVRTVELMTLCVHLRQDSRSLFFGLVLRLYGILYRIRLLFGVGSSRRNIATTAVCASSSSVLVGIVPIVEVSRVGIAAVHDFILVDFNEAML
jgi:hypothetical protein